MEERVEVVMTMCLEVSGVNQVITVDIHSPQTEGFFSIPVDCLTARFLFER